jgi:hypothetical protein
MCNANSFLPTSAVVGMFLAWCCCWSGPWRPLGGKEKNFPGLLWGKLLLYGSREAMHHFWQLQSVYIVIWHCFSPMMYRQKKSPAMTTAAGPRKASGILEGKHPRWYGNRKNFIVCASLGGIVPGIRHQIPYSSSSKPKARHQNPSTRTAR